MFLKKKSTKTNSFNTLIVLYCYIIIIFFLMTELKPYLKFADAATQTWINEYSIAVLLISIKLFSFTTSVLTQLETLSQQYTGTRTCQYLDYIIHEAPEQLSLAANYLIKKSLQQTLKMGFYFFADFLLVIFNIIFFLLEIWFGTYACLFLSAVDTTVDVAVNASEAVISVANETVHAATTDLNEGLNGLSEVVNDVLEVFEKVESKIESIFSSSDEASTNTTLQNKIKKINLTISSLNNFYINSDINNKLEKLADEVPTFDELKNDTKNWLEKPFYYVADELKNQDFASLTTPLNNSISLKSCQVVISNSSSSSSSSTTSSSLNKSETWCDNTLVPEIKKIFKILISGLKNFKIAIIVVAIVLFFFFAMQECLREFLFWKKICRLNDLVGKKINFMNIREKDEIMIDREKEIALFSSESSSNNSNLSERRKQRNYNSRNQNLNKKKSLEITDIYLTTFQEWQLTLLEKIPFLQKILSYSIKEEEEELKEKGLYEFNKNSNKQLKYLKYNWFIKYVFSKRSSILFLISICGFIVCLIQYIIIHKLQNLLNSNNKKNGIDTVLSFDKNPELKAKLQLLFQGITKSFSDWQTNTNEYITAVETRGNNEVVIKKIEYISSEINSTATKIYNSLSSTINDTFFGTIFEKPLTSVMNCIIGNKLKSISEGASWVKKEFQIELPRISSNDTEEIYSALTETDTNNSTINYTTSYLNYTTTTNNSNNNSTNYVADKTLNKVITEISSIKKDIKEDINKIFDYYMSTIKYEFSIVMILFILWCCQFVIAYLLLKLRYKVI